jgi:DNA-3-methyladenine glycosylase II
MRLCQISRRKASYLRAKDLFPLGDIAVMSAAIQLHPGTDGEDIKRLSGRWKPYRSLAAFFMWHYYLRWRHP